MICLLVCCSSFQFQLLHLCRQQLDLVPQPPFGVLRLRFPLCVKQSRQSFSANKPRITPTNCEKWAHHPTVWWQRYRHMTDYKQCCLHFERQHQHLGPPPLDEGSLSANHDKTRMCTKSCLLKKIKTQFQELGCVSILWNKIRATTRKKYYRKEISFFVFLFWVFQWNVVKRVKILRIK